MRTKLSLEIHSSSCLDVKYVSQATRALTFTQEQHPISVLFLEHHLKIAMNGLFLPFPLPK